MHTITYFRLGVNRLWSTIGIYLLFILVPKVQLLGQNIYPIAINESYTITAPTNYTNYRWQKDIGAGYQDIVGATNNSYTVNNVGKYRYLAKDANNCTVELCSPYEFYAAYAICSGESYTLTAQSGLSNLQWQKDVGTGYVNISGANNGTYLATTPGKYRYTATDANGCSIALCNPFNIVSGVCANGVINGFLFADNNRNGIQDAGDTPLSNISVQLKDSNGILQTSINTDNTGKYTFPSLIAGSYIICATTPTGYIPTSKQAIGSNSTNNSDINPSGCTDILTLTTNQNLSNIDAGYQPDCTQTASISGTITVCDNNTTILSASTGNSYLWNTGATTQNINVGIGTYQVTVSYPNSCKASTSVTVSAATTVTYPICPNESYTLTTQSGLSNIQWQKDSGNGYVNIIGATGSSYVVNMIGKYRYIATDANGCPITLCCAFNIISGICSTAKIGDYVFIDSNKNGIQDNGDLPLEGVTIILKNTAGTVIQSTTNDNTGHYTFNSVAAGTYKIQFIPPVGYNLTIKNAVGSSIANNSDVNTNGETDVFTITQGQIQNDIDAGYQTPCVSDAVINGNKKVCANTTTTLTASVGQSYLWNIGATTQSITVGIGTYSVTINKADACSSTASVTVTNDNSLANATIQASTTQLTCITPNATLSTTVAGASFLWSTSATTSSINVTQSGTYSVTITNSNACTKVLSIIINKDTNVPNGQISANSQVLTCTNPSTILTASGGTNYLWSTGNINPSISVSTAGTYSVTITGSNACSAVRTITITEDKALPLASISPSSAILTCANPSTTLTVSGGGTYLWSTGSSSPNITVTTASTYSVTVTGSNGCTTIKSAIITEDKVVPLASISPSSAILTCSNPNTTLTVSGGGTYLWSIGSTSPNITVTTAGTYSVTVTGSNGCTTVKSAIITEDKVVPLASISPSSAILTCSNPNTTLSVTGGNIYTWSTGSILSNITVNTAGTYSVTVTGGNGCTATKSAVVTENKTTLIANVNPISAILTCTNPSTTLTASGGSTYLWNTGNINPSININTTGTYTVTVTGSNGCTSVKSAVVTEDKITPLASISPSSAILTCANSNMTLTATGGNSYAWINGSTGNSIMVTTGGTYTVTVTGANGCSSTAQSIVTVNKTKPTVCIDPLNGILSCGNPSISISTTCQSATYAYNWSNGQTSPLINVNQAGIYFLTVTNTANGCTVVGNSVINNDQTLPSASITPSTATLTCSTPTATLIASGNGTYLWSTGAVSPSITVTTAGSYSVTVTGTNGCKGSANAVVFEDKSAPVISLSPISGILTCSKKSIKITASGGGTYLWSNGSTSTSITVTTAATYSVTVTGSNGCTAVKSAIITENKTVPLASISPNSAVLTCSNPNATLTASGGGTYLWSNGNTSTNITVNTVGTYSVTVTGSNGCTAVKSAIITENKTVPLASISPNSAVLTCSNPNATLTGSGGGTYLWSNGNTSTNITVTTAGTYSITVTSSNGCTAVKSAIITENKTVPLASISPNSAVLTCSNPNATLTASGGGTYLWSNGSTSTNITVNNVGTYSVTVTGSNGCTAVKSAIITENKTVPLASISPNSAVLTCSNPNATLTASGGGTYLWSNGSTSTNITVNNVGTYSVTVTGSNGCTAVKSAIITEDKVVPIASISSNSAVLTCSNPNATLTASGGGTYLWLNGSTSTNITVNIVGTYSVTVTGNNGCTSVKSAIITEDKAVPVTSISPNSAVLTCSNPNATLTASGGGTYLWSNGSTSTNITVNIVGTYSVTVTGNNGCTSVKSAIITEDKAVPVTSISPNSAVLTCSNPNATLTASGGGTYLWSNGSTSTNITVNIVGTYSVTVTGNNGCTAVKSAIITEDKAVPVTSISPNSAVLTCSNPNATLTASGGGTYLWSTGSTSLNITVTTAGTYSVTVTSSNGCTSVKSVVVTEDKVTPLANISPNSAVLTCSNPNATLTASGGGTYLWSIGSTSPNITVTTAGTYSVTVTSSNGCTAVKSTIITEDKVVPLASISPNSAVLTCSNSNATLTASGGGTYLWSNGSTSPNITVTTFGTYSVTVTGSNGCTAVKSAIITEDKVVPVASISPNSAVLTCSNPNATLTASGGGTYLWSNGSTSPNITVTTAGTYSVTVTGSNGCFIVKSVVVTENKNVPKQCVQPLTGVLTCSQPTMTLVAIGGGTYLWSTGSTASTIVVNTAGTYSVTVTTPNGCTTTGASVITENKTLPIAVITPNTGQLTCTINSVLLTVSGNGSYNWGNNVTSTNYIATQAGTYTVSVTGSNGCINTAQAIITENKSTPNITILPTSMTLPCGGGTVKLVANGGSVYRWSTGATSTSINVSVAGTYTVTATGTNGCTKSTSIIIGAAINCNTGSIGDYVFCDKNCNGIQDAGDTPINGVSVQLKNANTNAIISTTTTNNLGKYVFSNLVAGAYKVCFVTPIGYTPTLRKVLNSTNVNDSDIYATGETAIINLTSAQKLTNIDAGYKPYSSIGDCVFEDKNGNGLQDIGELGVPNIQVFLTGTVNGITISKTTITNSSGKYLFSELEAGTYSLYFALPSGYNFTVANKGLDDEKDSDVDPLTYKTSTYTLSTGQTNLSVDAGIYKLACIGDLVFIDANRNGIQDNGEISRSNVSLALTGVTGDGEIVNNVYTATNAEGKYKFYGLKPGTYCVSIYTPTGYLLSIANVGADDSKDSDFDNSTFKTPNVTLISGVDYLDFDAGIYDKFANPCPNDITPPIFVGIPANITVECDAIPYSSPSVVEDCVLGYDLIKNDVIISGNCANNVTVQRTWTATDRSGNTSQVTQTITVRDTKPPVIYGVPADVTIQCGDPIPVAPIFSPTGIRATDNCDKDVALTLSEIYYPGACTSLQHPNGIGQILCQWKAVDDCGNYSIKSWKITIVASSSKVASTSNNQMKEQQKEDKTSESSEISNNTEVLAFPNPTNGTFTLDFAGHKVTELLIFNSKGNTVYRSEVDIQQEQVKIELNSVNTGMYWVLMKTTKGYLSKKIIFIE